jgi:transposase-like protein
MGHGRRFWERVVAEAERSEDTHAEVAARHGVSIAALRSWLYRLRREPGRGTSEPRLLPVRVADRGEFVLATEPIAVVTASGLEVRVPAGADVAYVAALVRALG